VPWPALPPHRYSTYLLSCSSVLRNKDKDPRSPAVAVFWQISGRNRENNGFVGMKQCLPLTSVSRRARGCEM